MKEPFVNILVRQNQVVHPDEVKLERDLTFIEKVAHIVDRKVRKLRSKQAPMLKVIWQNQDVEATTWETEASMQERYSKLVENYLAGKFLPLC